jgi:hypothetical protein
LDRIARDNTTVTCPVIDGIADDTFEYRGGGSHYQVGGFGWNLQVWNFSTSVLNFIGQKYSLFCNVSTIAEMAEMLWQEMIIIINVTVFQSK